MAVFKEVWTLSGFGDRWQEVWYKNAASLSAALPVSPTILAARTSLLPVGISVERIRISDVNNPHLTDFQLVNLPGTDSTTSPEVAGSGETVVYGLSAQVTSARRRLNLRAVLTDHFISRSPSNPRGSVSAILDTRVKNFIILLQGANYLVYSRYRPGDTIDKPFRVLSVDGTAGDGNSKVIMAGLFAVHVPLLPDARLRFRQFPGKNLPNFNGSFQLIQIEPNQPVAGKTRLTVQYTTPENQLIATPSGIVQEEKFHADGILDSTKTQFLFVGTRQVKNAGIGSRGARSARRTRSQL